VIAGPDFHSRVPVIFWVFQFWLPPGMTRKRASVAGLGEGVSSGVCVQRSGRKQMDWKTLQEGLGLTLEIKGDLTPGQSPGDMVVAELDPNSKLG
jgi:hypothetical protein